MAPLLESEDEISEIEEAIAEAFIISSAKNSPLIERKESTNVVVLNCDSSKFQADATNMTNCENECNSSMNMIDKGGTGKGSLDITVKDTLDISTSYTYRPISNNSQIFPGLFRRCLRIYSEMDIPIWEF